MESQIYKQLFILDDTIKNEVNNIYILRPDTKGRCNYILECFNDEYFKYIIDCIEKMDFQSLYRLMGLMKLYVEQIEENSIVVDNYEDDEVVDSILTLLEELSERFKGNVYRFVGYSEG